MLVFISLNLIVISFTGSEFFYYVFFSLILITLLSFLLLQYNEKKMSHDIHIEQKSVIRGDDVEAEFHFKNSSLFSISHGRLKCTLFNEENNFPFPDLELSFIPSININKTIYFPMNKRGVFTNIRIESTIQDPLRLFSKSFVRVKGADFIVYPQVHELAYFHVPVKGLQGTERSRQRGQEDYSNIRKVRPYIAGDSHKRIHWKLSSKKNEVFVKEYEATSSAKSYLIMDSFRENYGHDPMNEIEDCLVEVTVAIAKYILKHNVESQIIFESEGMSRIENRDLSSFENVLRSLVGFRGRGKMPFGQVIREETKKMEVNAFITLVTPVYSDQLMDTLDGLKARNFKFSLIIVNKEKLDQEKRDYVEALGIDLYEVTPEGSFVEELETYK